MDNRVVGKTELLRRLRQGKAAMDGALAALSPEMMVTQRQLGDWSVKDLIAHFTAHEQRALGELRSALRGGPLPPDPGEDFNRRTVEASRWHALEDVRADWERSFREVITAVELLSDADFDPSGGVVYVLGDTIDGALANHSYAHYAEHLDAVLALVGQPKPEMR